MLNCRQRFALGLLGGFERKTDLQAPHSWRSIRAVSAVVGCKRGVSHPQRNHDMGCPLCVGLRGLFAVFGDKALIYEIVESSHTDGVVAFYSCD